MIFQRIQYGNISEPDGVKPSDDDEFFQELQVMVQTEGYPEQLSYLKICINGAFDYLDGLLGYTNRTLINSIFELKLDTVLGRCIPLKRPPLIDVLSVKIITDENQEITLENGTDYLVRGQGDLFENGKIVPLKTWPKPNAHGEGIVVRFTAGQGLRPAEGRGLGHGLNDFILWAHLIVIDWSRHCLTTKQLLLSGYL